MHEISRFGSAVTALLLCLCGLLGLHPLAARAGTIDVVLVAGDGLPDGPGTLFSASRPLLGDSGQLAVAALLTTGDFAIYRGGPAAPLVSVARSGQLIDGGQLPSTSISPLAINSFDQVAFTANTTGFGQDLYLFDDALGARRLAGPGDPAPGPGGGSIVGFVGGAFLDDAGRLVRIANVSGGNAILRIDSVTGALDSIVRTGQPTPDSPGVFANVGSLSVNEAGQVAFECNVTEGGIFTDRLIVRADPTAAGFDLFEVARSGDPAPQSPGVFVSVGAASINASGQIAFNGLLDVATTGTSGNDAGIYLYDDVAGLQEVVGFRDPDGLFGGFRAPQLNDAGQVALRAVLRGAPSTSDDAILLFENGAGRILAQEGADVPGGDGRFFRFASTGRALSLNNAGDVAFRADLLGVSGSESVLVRALYRYSEADGLVEVVRAGAPLLGSTITSVDFQAELFQFTGSGSGLNASGQMTFSFRLADGRAGVAIWTEGGDPSLAITSPAPGATVDATELLVEGIASDDGAVASVIVNGVPATLVSTDDPADPAEVAFSVLIPIDPGENTIVAVATDDDGNTAMQSLVIDNVLGPEPLLCDTDGNGSVDRIDIAAIFAARGTMATGPDDVRDINQDGLITVNDGRLCALACTYPSCATTAP